MWECRCPQLGRQHTSDKHLHHLTPPLPSPPPTLATDLLLFSCRRPGGGFMGERLLTLIGHSSQACHSINIVSQNVHKSNEIVVYNSIVMLLLLAKLFN